MFSWLLWGLLVCVSSGETQLTSGLGSTPHLRLCTRAPVLQKEAGLQGRVGCQGSDGSTLGVLRSPRTKAFHIVRALIQSPVFLLFSVAFGLGHKALNQHSAEPGKSETKAPD